MYRESTQKCFQRQSRTMKYICHPKLRDGIGMCAVTGKKAIHSRWGQCLVNKGLLSNTETMEPRDEF